MNEYKILISGSFNAFQEGWDSAGVYMTSGLYQSNTFKAPIYIGGSVSLQRRIEVGHINLLERNKHPNNPIFQIAWNKHGKDNFVWWLLESCDKNETLIKEQFYLDKYKPFKDLFGGFNINHTSSGCVGRKWTQQQREKFSKSNLGRIISTDTRKKCQ